MKAWNLSSRSDVPPANTPPQKIKTKTISLMLPPSPPLSLSLSLPFTLSAQTQSATTTTTKSIANADLKFTLLLSRPQIQRAQRFQRSPLSLSLSLHACNYHLTFCTSIIYIFYCWFGSVRKRAHISDVASGISEIGAVAVEHRGEETPPLAISFCKVHKILVK